MKKIKTTDITTGVAYPPSKKGLDFLQQSYQEVLGYLAQSFIGNTPSTTVGYVLYGCEKALISGSNYSLTAGAIYFNGEVYAVDAIASISIVTAPIMTITTTNDPTADPTIFTDGSSKNVHNIRKMVLSDGTLGTGTVNFVDLVFIQTEKWHFIGETGEPALLNSWTTPTRDPLRYKKLKDGTLFIAGIATNAGSVDTAVFTMPASNVPQFGDGYFRNLGGVTCLTGTSVWTGLYSISAFGGDADFLIGLQGGGSGGTNKSFAINITHSIDLT